MKKSTVLTAIHVTTTTAKQFVLKVTYIHMSRCSQRPSFFFFWSFCTSILSLFKLHVLCEILEGLLAGQSTSTILAYKDRLIRPLREHFAVVLKSTQIICAERFSYGLEKWFRLVFVICFISQWMKRSENGLFVFPPKKTLIWRGHCSIGQSCCSMTSKRAFLYPTKSHARLYPFSKPIKSLYFCSFVVSVLFARFSFKVQLTFLTNNKLFIY